MRKGRSKPRVRVVKQKANRKTDKPNRIHDEDVLRWKHMVSEPDAEAIARQAGYGTPCLPAGQDSPTLSPEPCRTAIDYVNALPEGARHALFRHCDMVARHQRLLLEGQERLRYIQTQIREMKARLPPPPLPQEDFDIAPGPHVTAVPVANPTCWASCCGLFELPDPPDPPPRPLPPGAPLLVQLPKPAYFQEAAAARVAEARRRTREQQQREQGQQPREQGQEERRTSHGGGQPISTSVQPVSTSVGGASDVPAPAAATPAAAAPDPGGGVGRAAELPGQLDPQTRVEEPEAEPQTGQQQQQQQQAPTGARLHMTDAAPDAGAAAPPTDPTPVVADLAPRPQAPLAPLTSKAPGAPQSLLRPLPPLPPPGSLLSGDPAGQPAGLAGRRSALPPLPGVAASPPAPLAPSLGESPGTAADGGGRSTDPASPFGAPAPESTAAPDAQDAEGDNANGRGGSGGYDTSRYQDAASLEKVTRIQATQRGRMARKEVAAIRVERQHQQHQQQEEERAVAMSTPALHPFADPAFGAPIPEPEPEPAGAPLAALDGDDTAGGRTNTALYDTSCYQDAASLEKVTRIQAAQRGRMTRREVAAIRSERHQQQHHSRHHRQLELQHEDVEGVSAPVGEVVEVAETVATGFTVMAEVEDGAEAVRQQEVREQERQRRQQELELMAEASF